MAVGIGWFVAGTANCSSNDATNVDRSGETGGGGAGGSLAGSGGTSGRGGATTGSGGDGGIGGPAGTGGTMDASSGIDVTASGGAGGSPAETDASDTCIPASGTTEIDADTVRDNETCLVWQEQQTCTGKWDVASACCAALAQGGFDDWRMPSVDELFTWPGSLPNTEIMTCPRYVMPNAGDKPNNYSYCAVTTYSGLACGHRGPANTQGTICVRGKGVNLPPQPASCDASCPFATDGSVIYTDCMQ